MECPFNKQNRLPLEKALGGSPVETYVGQAAGPFWLPCHMDKKYEGKTSDPNAVQQCAGAAIFRSNVGISAMMPTQLLRLPRDNGELVFNSFEEFVAFYKELPIEDVKIDMNYIRQCYFKEIMDQQAKTIQ